MKCIWLVMLFVHCTLSESFKVVGTGDPILAAVGSEVTLPCSIQKESDSSAMNAEDMKITWVKSDSQVHLYESKKDNHDKQCVSYKGRTSLDKEALKKGTASLKLTSVKASDLGKYTCKVESGGTTKEVSVELKEKFQVVGPSSPVTAAVGWNIILPCLVQRENDKVGLSAEDMIVTWSRPNAQVHRYSNKKDDTSQQAASYRGRTSLDKRALQSGAVTLRLAKVRPSDITTFTCTVQSGTQKREVSVEVTETFRVVGPDGPVLAAVGSDVILPCFVKQTGDNTGMYAVDLKVSWTKSDTQVHLYQNKADLTDQQSDSYKGRTALDKTALRNGNASLKLTKVTDSDMGTYNCTVGPESGNSVSLEVQEKFKVVGPSKPVTAEVGSDVTLQCEVLRENDGTKISAVDMKVLWTRPGERVHLYEKKADVTAQQSDSYRGRTSLDRSALQSGSLSLTLRNVSPSDMGIYQCTAEKGSQKREAHVSLGVKVIGTDPEITVKSLLCESKGWRPAPKLEWLDGNGAVMPAEVTERERSDYLVDVESRIEVDSGDSFLCRVTQDDTVKEETIEPYETCTAWMAAVGVVAVLFLLVLIVFIIKILKGRPSN